MSVENILAAAVTHLISDERRANINNMIKQKINWHRNQLLEESRGYSL